MLLGMLGFGLLWLAEVPRTVLETWWDRRHHVSHASYWHAVLGGWLLLGLAFVLLFCVALLIVMGLARLVGKLVVAARGAGVRRPRRTLRVRVAVPRAHPSDPGPRARSHGQDAGAASACRPRPGEDRGRVGLAPECGDRGDRAESPGRAVEHSPRRSLLTGRDRGRDRARARARETPAHPEVDRVVCASSPSPARTSSVAWPVGAAGWGSPRPCRSRCSRSSCSSCSRYRCRTRSRGTWRPRRTGAPSRRPATRPTPSRSSASSCRPRSRTRLPRPGSTSSARTTRRSTSGSRWCAPGRPVTRPGVERRACRPAAVELGVAPAAGSEQLVVGPALDHPAVLEHDDQVRAPRTVERRWAITKAVRPRRRRQQGVLDPPLPWRCRPSSSASTSWMWIAGSACSARGKASSWRLAEREAEATLAEGGVVAVLRAASMNVVGPDRTRRGDDLFPARLGAPEGDVVGDRPGEEEALLRDDPEAASQRLLLQRAQVASVDGDRSGGRVVEARDQLRNRRLPGARMADEGDGGAGRHVEVDPVQRTSGVGAVRRTGRGRSGTRPADLLDGARGARACRSPAAPPRAPP